MSLIDWVVFGLFLAWVVADGVRRGRAAEDLGGYYAGNRQIPWWAAGLSIMATQASAITVIGTTGQGHEDGMEFLQIYIGLPLAMVLLCIFIVPLLREHPILTAYEYLERRFGPVTRTIASAVFLVARCTALGIVIYAPSLVLSATTGLSETVTVLILGVVTTAYTMIGGVTAVVWTDVKQMLVIVAGLIVTGVIVVVRLFDEFTLSQMFELLGSAGKLNALEVGTVSTDFVPAWRPGEGEPPSAPTFWSDKYNLWTGLFGGTFLMLAYFGCDQSQAQRLLTSPSADDSRKALLVSGFLKLPMQIGVLLLGALLWLFHASFGAPLWFAEAQYEALDPAQRTVLEQRYDDASAQRLERMRAFVAAPEDDAAFAAYRDSVRAVEVVRGDANDALVGGSGGSRSKADKNYIFPHFVIHELPMVLVGLLFAAIFAAAMSSVDSVLNSLSAATTVDFYKRWLRPRATDAEALRVGRLATLGWGVFATLAALLFAGGGSIIEQINRIGSFFYGTLLGGFVLAIVCRRAGDLAAACGLVAGMASVFWVSRFLEIEFLWFNLIGCVAVVAVGVAVSVFVPKPQV